MNVATLLVLPYMRVKIRTGSGKYKRRNCHSDGHSAGRTNLALPYGFTMCI